MPKGNKLATNNKSASVGLTKPHDARLKVGEIVQALPQLNQQELKLVQAAVKDELLKYLNVDKETLYLVFDVVGEKPIAVDTWMYNSNGITWRRNQPALEKLISELTEGKNLRRSGLFALKKFLIEILIEDIKERYLPLNLKTICEQLQYIESAFNRAFPGYLKNKMQHLIVSSFTQTTR